jgi:predicted alpha/beta superfamily hydrolase
MPGTVAPFIVGADGPDTALFIAFGQPNCHEIISIGNGSGDGQGSEPGLEYDTMSGRHAEFVEQEVLPRVEKQYALKLSRNPEARTTMGGSSGGSCCFDNGLVSP